MVVSTACNSVVWVYGQELNTARSPDATAHTLAQVIPPAQNGSAHIAVLRLTLSGFQMFSLVVY